MIRSEATAFRYERGIQPLPKIGPWQDRLDALLLANEVKTPRERLTQIRMFEELRRLGYAGSYDAVRRYARSWRRERGSAMAEAYVPLSFAPGEAYQFDWSHEIVVMNGTTVKVKVAHLRLCHSRMLFVRACPRETREMVFEAPARQRRASSMRPVVLRPAAGVRLFQRDLRPRHLRQVGRETPGSGPVREPRRPDATR